MGTKERREREKQETREMILDAARELFATRGVEATTMRAIAEKIEYTPTAIYHHFQDKDALILEMCHADFRSLAREFVRIGRIDDPIERLRRIGQAYVQFAEDHPHHYRIMFMNTLPDHVHDGVEMNPEEDAYAFLLQTVTEAIEQGRFRPELADPEQVAQMTWAGVHGLVSLRIAKCNNPWIQWRDLKETSEKLIDATIRGFLRDPQAA